MTKYRCLDCQPRWTTHDPTEAQQHAQRFDCLIWPDPQRTRHPPPREPPPDHNDQQLTLDI